MRTRVSTALAAWAVIATALSPTFADEDLSIVVNPRTGAASLRNDSNAPIDVDGYLLRAGSTVFDPSAWNSLDEQGVSGWFDGPAAANRLGDTNLLGSTSIQPGASLSIGSPYIPFEPASIGEAEPEFDFTYSVPGLGSFTGDVEFSVRNTVVLVVDPATGEATLENQSEFGVDLDAYLIRSSAGVLSPTGWEPLQDSNPAWRKAAGAANRLAEGNLLSSTFLSPNGGSLSIGSPIDLTLLEDETDLALEYHVPGLGTLVGGVLFAPSTIASLPGDYNNDGRVDAADYTVWRDGGSPDSTQAGYDTWASNYGAVASPAAAAPGAASIPEPSGLGVAALAAVIASSLRRRTLGA